MSLEKGTKLWLDGDCIHYGGPAGRSWSLPLHDMLVVGEYTENVGPYLHDYWLVFIAQNGAVLDASFYSEKRDEFLRSLGSRLGLDIQLRLLHSTEQDSNVLWPLDIAGRPLFCFTEKAPRTLLARIAGLFGYHPVDSSLSPAVLTKIGQNAK